MAGMLQSLMVRMWIVAALLAVTAAASPALPPPPDDTLAHARELAFGGKEHRQEALNLLKQRLVESPGDNDVRTFYGTLLSWEGQYDEARKQLTEVLNDHPYHSDALPALVRVELFSDHPARAEQLAADSLQHTPKDVEMMMLLARAQRNQNHYRAAAQTLDAILVIEPANKGAMSMRRRSEVDSWKWEAAATHTTDFLSRGRDPQNEDAWQLRGRTPVGSLIGRVSRADRFGFTSYQVETDFYPHIRNGTYAYINLGASADANLYPHYRVGADLYQSVGHGFEVSGGFRHLKFTSGTTIYTWAVYKYYGDWLFSGRMYLTPDDLGVSKTEIFGVRRFFGAEGTHDYIEVRFSRGSSLALARTTLDLIGLNSTRVTIEADKTLGHFAINFKGGAGSEDQGIGGKLNRYTVQGSLYYRF
jgi:YaiO family outer membrane protein